MTTQAYEIGNISAFLQQCSRASLSKQRAIMLTIVMGLSGLSAWPINLWHWNHGRPMKGNGFAVITVIMIIGLLIVPLYHQYWKHTMKQIKPFWKARKLVIEQKWDTTLWPYKLQWWVEPFWDIAFARSCNQKYADSQPLEAQLRLTRLLYIIWLAVPVALFFSMTL